MSTPLYPGYQYSGKARNRLSYDAVKRLAMAYGLPGDAIAQIAKGESSLYADVQQKDPGDRMVGYGLLQMTPNAWGKGSAAYKHMQSLGGIAAMRDPAKNMAMARFLYHAAGNKLSPWYGTKFLTNRSGEGKLGPVDRAAIQRYGHSGTTQNGPAVASAASAGGGLPGMSGAGQANAAGDRSSMLASVLQRLDAATPKLAYNSPFSRTDDDQNLNDPSQFQGAPKSNLQQPQGGAPGSGFQPTRVDPAGFQPTNLGDLLASMAATRSGSSTSAPSAPTAGGGDTGDLAGGKGDFKVSGPNPKRIQSYVSNFMGRVADVFGHPITGSDGTGHSKYTVNGNVSEHFTGSAVDNPAKGATLTRMGQAALIAAGMDPSKARQQKGGLYNIYGKDGTRYQIIFNTMEGGNHWDHLHVGVRPGRRK